MNVGTWMSWVRAPPHGLLLVLPLVSDPGSNVDPCRQSQTVLHELGEKMKMLSRKYSDTRYKYFCDMADYLQVSRTALSYRMEQLGLLDNNRLIVEAEIRKKACRILRHALIVYKRDKRVAKNGIVKQCRISCR